MPSYKVFRGDKRTLVIRMCEPAARSRCGSYVYRFSWYRRAEWERPSGWRRLPLERV